MALQFDLSDTNMSTDKTSMLTYSWIMLCFSVFRRPMGDDYGNLFNVSFQLHCKIFEKNQITSKRILLLSRAKFLCWNTRVAVFVKRQNPLKLEPEILRIVQNLGNQIVKLEESRSRSTLATILSEIDSHLFSIWMIGE